MGFVLDAILKKIIDSDITVNTNYTSDSIDIDNREDEFAIQIVYKEGSNVQMTFKLEVSLDGINFAPILEADQEIIDNEGVHIWDVSGSGVSFIRVRVEVVSGSIQIEKITYSSKRRH